MRSNHIKIQVFFAVLFWFSVILISLVLSLKAEKKNRTEALLAGGRAFFQQAILTRAWNAEHGGVFVPITKKTRPNPYLPLADRDLTTDTGVEYTKINPAFMTREISELAENSKGIKFHITSLRPLRPGNEPHLWEIESLKMFQNGQQEFSSFSDNDSNFRYMAPLIVTKECLKCHEKQGYKEGDIRGGISVVIPVKPSSGFTTIWLSHVAVLLIGLLFICTSWRKLESKQVQLIKARKESEKANLAKSDFLANMSHEIRTPLNGIIGMTRLARDSHPEPQMQHYLETIQTSSDSLLQLINDILDFSKIEANQLELENRPFSLVQAVESAVQTINILASKKRLRLTVDIRPDVPPAVSGDSFRLRQILLNLLSNAVKFTEKGSLTIRVKRQRNSTDPVWLKFTVQDTGKGISPDQLEHIFDHFAQEDSSVTRKYGGTGLGLAICRELCQLMGGKIQVQSTLDKGSSFSVTLPFEYADNKKLTTAKLDSDKRKKISSPLHLLLVEDNRINRELAVMMLEQKGHQVTTAKNGLKALKILADQHFDAILMDVQMPEMDGLTCSRTIRAFEQGREIDEQIELPDDLSTELKKKLRGQTVYIVAMTAHAMSGDREKCLEAGMDGYLTKPFEPEKVTATLNLIATEISHQLQPSSKKLKIDTASESALPDSKLVAKARTHLKNKFNFKKELIDHILISSAKSFVEHLDRLEQAISQDDHDSLAASSHALKGSLLNLALNEEAELAQKIELAAGSREQAPYDQYLQKLRKNLEDFS
ncbi:MAG: ATP-binding protein [Thermodesulfobacteriota bacterium]|nr:ATP-binding protein [Thermodesulfobacteriota bacterium]